jgi:hypothetical protein
MTQRYGMLFRSFSSRSETTFQRQNPSTGSGGPSASLPQSLHRTDASSQRKMSRTPGESRRRPSLGNKQQSTASTDTASSYGMLFRSSTTPSKTPYSGASAMGHHFKTQHYFENLELHESEEDVCFYVTLPVLYNGETMEGRVQVMKTGVINITEPINIPLMDGKRDHNPLDYDHLLEKELLELNLEILTQSAEGKRLWETVESHGGKIKIVSGVGSSAFASSLQLGYLVAPENLETSSPYQVYTLAGLLREMELQLMEERRPDPFDDINEVLERNVALDLDILRKICIIVDELAEVGFEDIGRKFKKSGFEAFYSGVIKTTFQTIVLVNFWLNILV